MRQLYAFEVSLAVDRYVLVDEEWTFDSKSTRQLVIEAFDKDDLVNALRPKMIIGDLCADSNNKFTIKYTPERVEDVVLKGVVDYEISKVYRPIGDKATEDDILRGLPRFWFRR